MGVTSCPLEMYFCLLPKKLNQKISPLLSLQVSTKKTRVDEWSAGGDG